jgi:hypothetical protein
VNLVDVRDKLAAVLAPATDDDPNVLVSLVDALTPPCLMLGWAEPWLEDNEAATMGQCALNGHAAITAVAGRLSPGDGIATLETLVSFVRTRLATDQSNWRIETVTGPRVFVISKTNYLAARINVAVNIDG